MVSMSLLDMRWTSQSINNQYKLVGNTLHLQINGTRVVAVHKRQYYTLTRTTVLNHTSHRKDMKYEIIQCMH